MSAAEEARAGAERRFPDSGWDESVRTPWRHGFIDGAKWRASRPITDAQVAAAARAYWLAPVRSTEAEAMRIALEAARGVIS